METFRTIAQCRRYVHTQRQAGRTVGFVPTMGAVHEGHLSLMERSRGDNDITIISIFVNPTQFGPGEDYERYPRAPRRDSGLAAGVGVDAIFAPSAGEMYRQGAATFVDQSGQTIAGLEGKHRPGHFRGVLTVVAKLLNIVRPDRAYFGQKDYQQALVVQQMVRDLDMGVHIVVCPTIRAPDGLALSSRNQYLDPPARRQARSIYRGLQAAQEQLQGGETRAATLAQTIEKTIRDAGPCEIDYVTVAHRETLAPVDTVDGPAVALVAVRIAGTRLIDNCLLTPKG